MPREGWLCKPFNALRYGLSAAPSLDQLSLRELEAFPCPGLTGFFAFFHARIASQQTFEPGAQSDDEFTSTS